MELRAKDNIGLMLSNSSSFFNMIQLEIISKKFIMPTLATYDGAGNSRDHVLNYKTIMELQTHSDA